MNQITQKKKRQIKHMLSAEKPTVQIGKNGPTPQTIKEIQKQLNKNKTVKIKILKTALTTDQTKQIATLTAQQTQSTLIETRGHTFILYKTQK